MESFTLNRTDLNPLFEKDCIKVILEDDNEILCSKSGLIQISNYFRALLNGNFRESNSNQVFLQNVPAQLFNTILLFYLQDKPHGNVSTPKIKRQNIPINNINHAWLLIEVADRLDFSLAAAELDKYISNHITLENAKETCFLAHTFNRWNVVRNVVRCLALSKCDEPTKSWTETNGIPIIDSCWRSKTGNNLEEHETRKQDIPSLSQNSKSLLDASNCTNKKYDIEAMLKLYELSHSCYVFGGYNYDVKASTKCLKYNVIDFIQVAKTDKNVIDEVREVNDIQNQNPNRDFELTNDSAKNDNNTLTFNKPEPRLSFPDKVVEDYRTVAVETSLYVIGGFYYSKKEASANTWRYDTRNNFWCRMQNMKHSRFHHCAGALEKRIYVCGGYDGNNIHSTVEAFDVIKDVWISLPDMPIGVGNAACAVHKKSIYIICGQFGAKSIHTTRKVQQFDSVSRQWSLVSEYNSPEYGLSCGVIQDNIIMVGGQTLRVDCYNVETNQWKRLSNMSLRRIDACVLIYQERILVAGGYDYITGEYHDSVEIYDIKTDTWSMSACKLLTPVKNVGFFYVFDVEKKH